MEPYSCARFHVKACMTSDFGGNAGLFLASKETMELC